MTTMTAATRTGIVFDDIAILPNGTVTLTLGPADGEMRVYMERNADQADLDLAFDHITAAGGLITGAWLQGDVDVMRVALS